MSVRTIRVLVLLSLVLSGLGALSTTATARSSYVVTASVNKTSIVLGQAVIFTGSVSPRAAGKTVVLQKRYRTTEAWTDERTATIASDGTFRVSDRPSSLKARWYRIKKPASGSTSTGYSSTFRVLVYKWHYLTDFEPVDSDYFSSADSLSINGVSYKKSLYQPFGYSTDYIEYNLSRRCSKLTGVFGLSDHSKTGARANIEVLGDGNSMYTRTFDLGQSERRELSVANVLRIRIETTVQSDPSAYPAVGSPRVLCRF